MTSLILNDGYEIQIASSSRYNYIIAYVADYNGLGNLMSKLTRNNLSNVSIKFSEENIETHHNMALMEPHVSVTQRSGDLQIEFGLRELSQEEVTEETLLTAISYLSDEQALTVKSLYLEWDSDPIGYEYKTSNSSDSRRQFNGKLWKLNKDHKKQLDWYPGADPTLWTEIVEGHEGTIEDPIPVPDSVTTSGFEYVYGKYYQEGEQIYLAKRDGKEDGETEKLFYAPSALINQYFVLVTEESGADVESGHSGSKEDPIPVPEDVATKGFEYEYGKYYSEGEKIYLAKRTGVEDGTKVTLNYAPSALIGQYFEEVTD